MTVLRRARPGSAPSSQCNRRSEQLSLSRVRHGQSRNYRAGSLFVVSYSTFDVHVANITRASETRGAQFHSREHKQRIGHSAH